MATTRRLPAKFNPLITKEVDDEMYMDLVNRRRLGQHPIPDKNSQKRVFNFAHLRAPLVSNITTYLFPSGTPDKYFIMRRCTDGYVSATGMFKATFPEATAQEEEAERKYILSLPTTSRDMTTGNVWIPPEQAEKLADEYKIRRYIDALLDPSNVQPLYCQENPSTTTLTPPPVYHSKQRLKQNSGSPPATRPTRERRSVSPPQKARRPIAVPRKRRANLPQAPQPAHVDTIFPASSSLMFHGAAAVSAQFPASPPSSIRSRGASEKSDPIISPAQSKAKAAKSAINSAKTVEDRPPTPVSNDDSLDCSGLVSRVEEQVGVIRMAEVLRKEPAVMVEPVEEAPKITLHLEQEVTVDEAGEEVKRRMVDLQIPLPPNEVVEAAKRLKVPEFVDQYVEQAKDDQKKAVKQAPAVVESTSTETPSKTVSKDAATLVEASGKRKAGDMAQEIEVGAEAEAVIEDAAALVRPAKRPKNVAQERRHTVRKRAFYGLAAAMTVPIAVSALFPIISPYVSNIL